MAWMGQNSIRKTLRYIFSEVNVYGYDLISITQGILIRLSVLPLLNRPWIILVRAFCHVSNTFNKQLCQNKIIYIYMYSYNTFHNQIHRFTLTGSKMVRHLTDIQPSIFSGQGIDAEWWVSKVSTRVTRSGDIYQYTIFCPGYIDWLWSAEERSACNLYTVIYLWWGYGFCYVLCLHKRFAW